jgi:radical SAM superfamily enzyme YgiQ (UPF0313 family)
MKIAFVYPGYFNDSNRWVSHGLRLLSACAKQDGHETALLDLRLMAGWEEFRSGLLEIKPDVVAITVMTINCPPSMKAAEEAKKLFPQVPVIAGGIHVTLMPEDFSSNLHFDHLVLGEGEIVFTEILRSLAKRERPEKIIRGKPANLDLLPMEDLDLFKGIAALPIFNLPVPFVSIISSRGCLYKCTFCQPAERLLFGNTVRRKSVDRVIEELKLIQKATHFESFMIHDDCLSEARPWIEEFCEKYTAAGLGKPWACQVRADHVCRHPELIAKMKNAGLAGVHVGFESGSQKMLDLMEKGITVKQNYDAYKILKKLGIQIFGMFILGLPTETKQDVSETIKMLQTMRLTVQGTAFFTPFPGTVLYDYCKKNGLLAITDYRDYDRAIKTPKIKGIDYDYLEKQLLKGLPIERRIKRAVKKIMSALLGEKRSKELVGSIKSFFRKGKS